MRLRLPLLAILVFAGPSSAVAEPALRVRFREQRSEEERTIEGRVLVEAADGGMLLEDRQGILWTVTPEQLRERTELTEPFALYDGEGLAAALREAMGEDFRTISTRHYVLCSSADSAYTEWVAELFERLLRGFLQFWKQAGWELQAPERPLPALIFRTKTEYAAFAVRDAGAEVVDRPGYYSVRTNRIVLYDLAGLGGRRPANPNEIEQRVAAAPGNVATIVHEATHQIAFNCGMHTRYADTPLWVAEGIALFCEAPDLRSTSGWRGIGRINLPRLRRFREFADSRRTSDSLSTLIQSDERFRDPAAAEDAYAESWALVNFLIRTRQDEFVAYLQQIAAKPRLRWDSADERLEEFRSAFGSLEELEPELIAFVRRIRAR